MNTLNDVNTIEELEQMRQEFGNFKAILKKQQIVSEKMMRRAMQKDYAKERKSVWLVVILVLLFYLPFGGMAFCTDIFPMWFFVFTIFFTLACIGATVYTIRRYVSDDLMTGEVVTVAEHLANYKRFNNRWLLYFGIPILVLWLGLFFYFVGQNAGDFARGMIVGGVIGGIIGGICGVRYYLDSMRRVNGMLAQIEELKS